MKGMLAGKAVLTLSIFMPLAVFPASGRCALLSSQTLLSRGREITAQNFIVGKLKKEGIPPEHTRKTMGFLSLPEIEELVQKGLMPYRGGSTSSPLETNETVAIILTLIMIGTMVGFVEQNH